MAQWVARLTRYWWIPVSRKLEPHEEIYFYPNSLVLVGSRNGFKCDKHKPCFTIELK